MKKLLPSITLALASLASLNGFASAGGTFGLFTGCGCCKACGGTITLRQYNAFSPVACGSMMFQGCVVAPPPPQPPAYGYGGGFEGFSGFSGDCPDGSCGGGETISRMPTSYPSGVYPAPVANYNYAQAMQMAQMQAWQQAMAMQQMRVMQAMQQAPQTQQMQQMPVGPYSTVPVQATLPGAARMP
jgi:hypothetical protein